MEDIKTIGCDVTDKSLGALLNEQATVMPSEYDSSNWCYLPMWFKVTGDKIIAYHFSQLPENIKWKT